MTPAIENLTIDKVRDGRLSVSFDYTRAIDGFDHALVLIGEADSENDRLRSDRDEWSIRPRDFLFSTASGPVAAKYLDFYNERYQSYWNDGDSTGPRDDAGNRRFIKRLMPNSEGHVEFTAFYDWTRRGDGHDHDHEFYAVVGIVSTLNNHAAVQLGDIAYSNIEDA